MWILQLFREGKLWNQVNRETDSGIQLKETRESYSPRQAINVNQSKSDSFGVS